MQTRVLNQTEKAKIDLLETTHDLSSRDGLLKWLAAVGVAMTHDLPEMSRQKAQTCAYVASVSLKALKQ